MLPLEIGFVLELPGEQYHRVLLASLNLLLVPLS
jgi:hypothetical protein